MRPITINSFINRTVCDTEVDKFYHANGVALDILALRYAFVSLNWVYILYDFANI